VTFPGDDEARCLVVAPPVLALRPYVHTNHQWQVYFDANKAIRDTFSEAGYPVAGTHVHHRTG
jgi:small conductance mechanosensitive channel